MKSQRAMFFGALVVGLAAGSQAIAGGSIPLPSGNFSLTVSGTESTSCTSTGCLVLNIIEAGATVRDSAGNGCGTHVAIVNTLPPGPVTPIPFTITHVFKKISYDPTTGIGEQSLTEYFGGGMCNGALFNGNVQSAITTGSLHFVVSEGGNRIDNIVTSLSLQGTQATGFSLIFTERSQTSQNQQ